MSQAFDFIPLTLLIVAVIGGSTFYFVQFYRPRKIQHRLTQIPDFSSDVMHIGLLSGIAFDFETTRVAFDQNGQTAFFSEGDIQGAEPITLPVTDEKGQVVSHRYKIFAYTNDYESPKFEIDFGSNEKKALQCMISWRRWFASSALTPLLESSENPNESNEIGDISMPDSKTEISANEQPFADELTSFLVEQGFSHLDGLAQVKKERVLRAIDLISENYKNIWNHPLPKKDEDRGNSASPTLL